MTSKKNAILRLRQEGKTYNEIVSILGCSKSTVAYHCGEDQKEKTRKRTRQRRETIPFLRHLDHFKAKKGMRNKTHKFQIREGSRYGQMSEANISFNYQDVLERIGQQPSCYLTGRPINLNEPDTYNFDHIVPASKGGDNSLDNLGLALKEANQGKSDMLLDDFLDLCEDVLRHHGRIS